MEISFKSSNKSFECEFSPLSGVLQAWKCTGDFMGFDRDDILDLFWFAVESGMIGFFDLNTRMENNNKRVEERGE